MRTTSLTFRQAIYAQETNEVFVVLVEIDHADLASPIRVCSNDTDITSNGNVFTAYPFNIELPSDDEGDMPQARLTIDNVDQSLTASIRTIQSPPSVRIMVVLASAPDVLEVDMPDFVFSNITYDAFTISGTISIESFMNEPFPGDVFTPSQFPGLF
jgi:hypothetical protein